MKSVRETSGNDLASVQIQFVLSRDTVAQSWIYGEELAKFGMRRSQQFEPPIEFRITFAGTAER